MNSLRFRLSIVAAVVLIVFLGLSASILDRAFQQSAMTSERLRLQTYINDLLRVADARVGNTSLIVPAANTDRQFHQAGSGLYATVVDEDQNVMWRSASLMDIDLSFSSPLDPGERVFVDMENTPLGELYELSMGIAWITEDGEEKHYTISVAQTKDIYVEQVQEFRRGMWLWLSGLFVLLIVAQWVILNWGLSPLKKVALDVQSIENGDKMALEGDYPIELKGLTSNLNALIRHERERQIRYRNAMADLAHSLKTPLAVLRNAVEGTTPIESLRSTMGEQVDRLDQIASYQLQRAATAGKRTFSKPIKILPLILKVSQALNKVYSDKQVQFTHDIVEDCCFYGEEGDFMEIMGNLLDNAYKYCDKEVSLKARLHLNEKQKNEGLDLIIMNDGQGIPENMLTRIMHRGERADTTQAGYGIGLAVVNDIVSAYGGDISFKRSEGHQGTLVEMFLPK